jgi:hypothetical protein
VLVSNGTRPFSRTFNEAALATPIHNKKEERDAYDNGYNSYWS